MDVLEKLHLTYLLKVPMSTCDNMVYGELGRFPIHIAIKIKMIGYWGRLLLGKQSKLSKIMYDCLLSLYMCGVYKSPWLCNIKMYLVLVVCQWYVSGMDKSGISLSGRIKCAGERKLQDLFILQ